MCRCLYEIENDLPRTKFCTVPCIAQRKMMKRNNEEIMKKFTYFWLDGKREVLEGTDAANAMNRAGYGAGAVRALDFHSEGDNNDYVWNSTTRNWDMTEESKKEFNKKHNIGN